MLPIGRNLSDAPSILKPPDYSQQWNELDTSRQSGSHPVANRRDLKPSESAKTLYGHRLRKHRDKRNWSQPQLAKEVFCSPDLISKIETGVNVATLPMSIQFDELFGLDQDFEELQPLAAKEVIPWWFRPYTEFENQATAIRIFDPLHIPGLLQPESSARAILRSHYDGDALEQGVAARVGRQRVLTRKDPIWLFVLMSEWALRRPVGDRDTKREQLQHLLELSQKRNITIQIVPDDAGNYTSGSFTLFSFTDEPAVGWVDSVGSYGRPIDKRSEIEELRVEFDLIGAVALTAEDSATLIRTLLEDF
jgi:transcriptional regulator with XRE-family HTH domain